GGGSPCPCDVGVAIGTPGTGKDDIFRTTFVLDATADLAIEDFVNQLAGVRVTSVGSFDGDSKDPNDPKDVFKDFGRSGSAKLIATIPDPNSPVPEPSTALLVGLGTVGLGAARRRAR